MVCALPPGVPVSGQFCQASGGTCYDASGLTACTFVVPLASLSHVDAVKSCDVPLYIVTHAEVTMDRDGDGILDHETAFGGDKPGTGPHWWFHGIYTVCCQLGPPPREMGCETAFAKGSRVFTTDKKSNPVKLPSLMPTKNRWGWAINLATRGTTTYDIWAGAGLNSTANGAKVGT